MERFYVVLTPWGEEICDAEVEVASACDAITAACKQTGISAHLVRDVSIVYVGPVNKEV